MEVTKFSFAISFTDNELKLYLPFTGEIKSNKLFYRLYY